MACWEWEIPFTSALSSNNCPLGHSLRRHGRNFTKTCQLKQSEVIPRSERSVKMSFAALQSFIRRHRHDRRREYFTARMICGAVQYSMRCAASSVLHQQRLIYNPLARRSLRTKSQSPLFVRQRFVLNGVATPETLTPITSCAHRESCGNISA